MSKNMRFAAILIVLFGVCFGIPYFAPVWVTLGTILLLLLFIFSLIVIMHYREDEP